MQIRLNPPLPPSVVPDVIEVWDMYNASLLGTIRFSDLQGGTQGYSFFPSKLRTSGIGGKNTLRDIANACEAANKLRGTDY